MSASAGAAVELLKEYLATGQALLALARDKQQALISNDTGKLDQITSDEITQLERLEQLDKRRQAMELDFNSGAGDDLESLKAAVRQVFSDIRTISQENVALSQQALGYLQWSLRLISGQASQPTYGADGAPAPGPGQSVVDHKA